MHFASDTAKPQTSLDAFVRRHTGEVWHYLRVCGCDRHTADDLTQEVFLVALRKGFRPHPERTARRYLRRTARYAFLQHRQNRARDRWEPESNQWLDAADAEWERRQSNDRLDHWLVALRACRQALQGRRGTAVKLFYGERLSRAEVAERLAMTENGVKTLLQRVRADLRECVERALA